MNTVRSSDGTVIAFDRSGEGPSVIIVEGAFCDRSTSAPLAALLAPHFTVFAYDRRGRGDSGNTPPYAVEREVEDLQAVIAAAGGSAFVYGMSSGAALALETAARGPGITKLVLFEPPFDVDGGLPDMAEGFATRLNELISAGRRGDAVEFFLTKAVGFPAEVVAQMRNAPMWPAMEQIAPTLAYDTALTADNSLLTERAPAATVPTLVIDGGESPTWARNAVRVVAETLPNGQRYTLQGQTHNVSPDALAPVLDEFFAAPARQAADRR